MLGINAALQLGVDDLVAPVAEVRGRVDLLEEVGPSLPAPGGKRALVDHGSAGLHRQTSRLGGDGEVVRPLDRYDLALGLQFLLCFGLQK